MLHLLEGLPKWDNPVLCRCHFGNIHVTVLGPASAADGLQDLECQPELKSISPMNS